jgi:transcription antitermination factor NusG
MSWIGLASAASAPINQTVVAPNWYAIYTAVNQEKRVSEKLRQHGIKEYLPLYRSVRCRSDRRVVLDLPLFPGYLFVHINLAERNRVLALPRVVRLVGSRAMPCTVPDDQIEKLQLGLSSGRSILPCSAVAQGCRVRVTQGPFVGFEGILLRTKSDLRIVVSVNLIARSFSVEVGAEDIECVP